MRILLVNQFFHPDTVATAQYLTELALELRRRGHEVTALCGRRSHDGVSVFPAREEHSGIRIVRVSGSGFGRRSLAARVLDCGTFFAACAMRAAGLPCDGIVCLTTPPFLGIAAALRSALRRTPFVLWLMDLYPEVLVAEGLCRAGGAAAGLLAAVERLMLRRASLLLLPSRGMQRTVEARFPLLRDRCATVPLGPVGNPPPVAPERNRLLAAHPEWRGVPVVLYSGNMGLAHDTATVLEGNDRMPANRCRFLFAGSGQRAPEVARWVQRRPADSCLIARQPLDLLPDLLAAGDIHVVAVREPYADLVMPSKVYGALAAGRPVLYVGPAESDTALLLRELQCGFTVPNGRPDLYAARLQELLASESLRSAMGARARRAAETACHGATLRARAAGLIEEALAAATERRAA